MLDFILAARGLRRYGGTCYVDRVGYDNAFLRRDITRPEVPRCQRVGQIISRQ